MDLPLISISIRYITALSLRSFSYVFIFRTCLRRPGFCPEPWRSWHLQVVIFHPKSWTSLTASFAFGYTLPCERAYRASAAAREAKRLVDFILSFRPQRAPLAPTWYLASQSSHLNNVLYILPASLVPFFHDDL